MKLDRFEEFFESFLFSGDHLVGPDHLTCLTTAHPPECARGVPVRPTPPAPSSSPASSSETRPPEEAVAIIERQLVQRLGPGRHGVARNGEERQQPGRDAAERGRDQVARLMGSAGIQGAKRRGKPWRTTIPDPQAQRASDLVNRDFTADKPGAKMVGS